MLPAIRVAARTEIPTMPPKAITQQDLADVAHRLALAFSRRTVLPLQSLQYRLGETGSPRIEPRLLIPAIRALQRERGAAAIGRPWLVAPGLYASPEFEHGEAIEAATAAGEALDRLAAVDWEAGFAGFVADLVAARPGGAVEMQMRLVSPTLLAGVRGITALETTLAWETDGGPLRAWVTQEAPVLHPDDARLWAFLEASTRCGAYPVVVARKVHPALFVLLKRLAARAYESHVFWAASDQQDEAQRASDAVGWFPVRDGHHRRVKKSPLDQLRALDLRGLEAPAAERERLLAAAREEGMMTEGGAVRLSAWAARRDVAMPEGWQQTVRRWAAIVRQPEIRFDESAPPRMPAKRGSPAPSATLTPSPPEAPTGNDRPASGRGFGRETTVSRVPVRGY